MLKFYNELDTPEKKLINSLVKQLIVNDTCTANHSIRVMEYAVKFSRYLNLTEDKISIIRNAAILHDIGKLFIPKNILFKQDKLTTNEFNLIKHHSLIGYTLLKDINSLSLEANIILHHHEKVDGSGYPLGLKDNELTNSCKIISICDSFDAMTSNRIYKKSLNMKEAISELEKNAGSQFDKTLTCKFIQFIQDNYNSELLDSKFLDINYNSSQLKDLYILQHENNIHNVVK